MEVGSEPVIAMSLKMVDKVFRRIQGGMAACNYTRRSGCVRVARNKMEGPLI